ncbi:MAG TPA: HAD domain-containing protein [Noviherbaspirillum sp.]|uniref:HAD domain-containing protein n=1 Tax=Noviherbaspirillum sp. TaxID=1926288 RepID=UPI002B467498|nr:HAD domain-containing protein [Noviherbaspirillum sp.]HJV87701.1 HAD domain-containing protein [Noviherbaspirillum sp.]
MIVFLDFDGVLHPFHRPDGAFSLRREFERVMRDYGEVDIVISSTWREAHALEELRAMFAPDIGERIIDVTPVCSCLKHEYVREAEILRWLHEAGREAEAWVAIDDTAWFFSPGCANLILVNTETGFNFATERELRRRLAR